MDRQAHAAAVLASISSIRDCLLYDLAGQQLCARLTGAYQAEFQCNDHDILKGIIYV